MGFKLIKLKSVNSTNLFAKQIEKAVPQPDFCCIYTDNQLSGRGQAQTVWESEPNANLTFSLILHPKSIAPHEQFYISKLIAASIADFFNKEASHFWVKWPNDIYFNNKKLAGILIENAISGKNITTCIVGIGLNINQTNFSENLPNPISLKQIHNKTYRLEPLLKQLINHIQLKWNLIENRNFIQINELYFNNLYLFRKFANYKDATGKFVGKIIGTEETGKLIIETKKGTIKKYDLKELSYL